MGMSPSADIFYGFITSDYDCIFDIYDCVTPELKKYGCIIEPHGYLQDPESIFIAIKDTHITTWWDNEFDLTDFMKYNDNSGKEKWRSNMKKLCNELGLEYKEPKWLLVVSYG